MENFSVDDMYAQRLKEAHDFTEENIKKSGNASKLSDDFVWEVTKKVVKYCEAQSDIQYRPYQREFVERLVYSVLVHDGEEITALWSRQSGKSWSIAGGLVGLAVILPILANIFDDERFKRFKKGIAIGVFGPTYDKAGIIYNKSRKFLYSKHTVDFLKDPEIGIDMKFSKALSLPNGSYINVQSLAPGTKVEGETYDLIVFDECQDIDSYKIRKSVHPMAAATLGTLIKVGTPIPHRGDFYDACNRNGKRDCGEIKILKEKTNKHRFMHHFLIDYRIVEKCSENYRKYIIKEKMRLGEDSDEFRMSYKCEWPDSRGRFVTADVLEKCSIKKGKLYQWLHKNKEVSKFEVFSHRCTEYSEGEVIAAIDIGRAVSSTVITVGKIWSDYTELYGKEKRHRIHILDWLELFGDDHELQHVEILDYLSNFTTLSRVIIDATGKGDPICSRLTSDLSKRKIKVVPFIFSKQSKHSGFTIFHQELVANRFTFPVGVHNYNKCQQNFLTQMEQLEKDWNGQWLVVEKSDIPGSKDDFPISAMMLCWLGNVEKAYASVADENPFYTGNYNKNIFYPRRRYRR